MKIIVDSREQAPFNFSRYNAEIEKAALSVGDYSLIGFQHHVAIERKEINDLIGCLMGSGRDRFERELSKARYFDLFAVVVEASMEDISRGRYRSQLKPQSALQSVFTFHVRYRVPFIWAGTRDGAEYTTYSLLSKYFYEIEQRYKQAAKAL